MIHFLGCLYEKSNKLIKARPGRHAMAGKAKWQCRSLKKNSEHETQGVI